jgi:hypothetical protein
MRLGFRRQASLGTRDYLSFSAMVRCSLRWGSVFAPHLRGVHDSIRLVGGVERVGCTGLALAPATVAGVDDGRRGGQSIPDLAASASAFHGGPPTNGGSNTRILPFRQAHGNGRKCVSAHISRARAFVCHTRRGRLHQLEGIRLGRPTLKK